MRKFFVMMLIMFLITCGISEAAQFNSFPMNGMCVGNYVRYRARPSTNATILGRLFEYEEVTVISQKKVKGHIWYEIERPDGRSGTAWVLGKYLVPGVGDDIEE